MKTGKDTPHLASDPSTSNLDGSLLPAKPAPHLAEPRTTRVSYQMLLAEAPENSARPTPRHGGLSTDSALNLYQTHELVNRGAQEYGDILMTLRGGISHQLAEQLLPPASDNHKKEQERRDLLAQHRRALALSWFSVESESGAPAEFVVPHSIGDNQVRGSWATLEALRETLALRGVERDEIEGWITDCKGAFDAPIREDAVWINRSKAFDVFVDQVNARVHQQLGATVSPASDLLTRESGWDLLSRAVGNPEQYLAPVKLDESAGAGKGAADAETSCIIAAGGYFSQRFGTGEGADFAAQARVRDHLADWAESIQPVQLADREAAKISFLDYLAERSVDVSAGTSDLTALFSYRGSKTTAIKRRLDSVFDSAKEVDTPALVSLAEWAREDAQNCREKTDRKGPRGWADVVRQQVEERLGFRSSVETGTQSWFISCLDFASRRVTQSHSWIKRSEAERLAAGADVAIRGTLSVAARQVLDRYVSWDRADGGLPRRISKQDLGGWTELTEAWSRCATEVERRQVVDRISDLGVAKIGDLKLFQDLASDARIAAWRTTDNKPDAKILIRYQQALSGRLAQLDRVPVYTAPDALRSPCFLEYGESRPEVNFDLLNAVKSAAHGKGTLQEKPEQGLSLSLLSASGAAPSRFKWSSDQFMREVAQPSRNQFEPGATPVARLRGTALAAAQVVEGASISIESIMDAKRWNARLMAPRDELQRIAELRDQLSSQGTEREEIDRRVSARLQVLPWHIAFSPNLAIKGPWSRFAQQHAQLELNPSSEYWPHAAENRNRGSAVKLGLCRIPELRVLSVALEHDSGAAASILQALPLENFISRCRAAGKEPPGSDAVSFVLQISEPGEKHRSLQHFRRIGPDLLPNGEPHPAPWALMERGFAIKLPGEGRGDVRKASPAEFAMVRRSLTLLAGTEKVPDAVDQLQALNVSELRRAVQLHKNLAWISQSFQLAGDRRVTLDDSAAHIGKVLKDLVRIQRSVGSADAAAIQKIWDGNLSRLLAVNEGEMPEGPHAAGAFARLALTLVDEPAVCSRIGTELARIWAGRDQKLSEALVSTKSWMMGRIEGADNGAERHVGGVSQTRINSLALLLSTRRAFSQRMIPTGVEVTGRELRHPGVGFDQDLWEKVGNLKRERERLLVNRVTEVALGMPMSSSEGTDSARTGEACQVVVLSRSAQTGNRAPLVASERIRDLLASSCLMHDLHFREVQGVSRVDALSGAPGIRVKELSVNELIRSDGEYSRRIAEARAQLARGKGDAEARLLVGIAGNWSPDRKEWTESRVDRESGLRHQVVWRLLDSGKWSGPAGCGPSPMPVRVPNEAGQFLINTAQPAGARGAPAAVNEATLSGLRILTDPDWAAGFLRIPIDPKTGQVHAKSVAGGAVFENVNQSLIQVEKKSSAEKGAGNQFVYAWRDASQPIDQIDQASWSVTPAFWAQVRKASLERMVAPPVE